MRLAFRELFNMFSACNVFNTTIWFGKRIVYRVNDKIKPNVLLENNSIDLNDQLGKIQNKVLRFKYVLNKLYQEPPPPPSAHSIRKYFKNFKRQIFKNTQKYYLYINFGNINFLFKSINNDIDDYILPNQIKNVLIFNSTYYIIIVIITTLL